MQARVSFLTRVYTPSHTHTHPPFPILDFRFLLLPIGQLFPLLSLHASHSLNHTHLNLNSILSPLPLLSFPLLPPHNPISPPSLSLPTSLIQSSPPPLSPRTLPTISCQLPFSPHSQSLHLSQTRSHVSISPSHSLHTFSSSLFQ